MKATGCIQDGAVELLVEMNRLSGIDKLARAAIWAFVLCRVVEIFFAVPEEIMGAAFLA
jgi:hypothetical protein